MKKRSSVVKRVICAGCIVFAVSTCVNLEAEEITIGGVPGRKIQVSCVFGEGIKEILAREAAGKEWNIGLFPGKEDFRPEAGASYDLKVEDETGKELVCFGLELSRIEDLQVGETDGATYVKYHDVELDEDVDTSSYPLIPYGSPRVRYTTEYLNVRETPDTGAKILGTLAPGAETELFAETDGWVLIRLGDGYGYVSADYLTDDPAKIQQDAGENNPGEVNSPQEEDSPAGKDSSQEEGSSGGKDSPQEEGSSAGKDSSQEEGSSAGKGSPQEEGSPAGKDSPQEVYVVSRESIPGCDDPDHGTTYITYSDGRTEAVDY